MTSTERFQTHPGVPRRCLFAAFKSSRNDSHQGLESLVRAIPEVDEERTAAVTLARTLNRGLLINKC